MRATRRDVLRKAALAGSLIAIPGIAGALVSRAEAGVCALPPVESDRALFEAIRDWRVINVAYLGLGIAEDDDDCDALSDKHAAAVLRVLDIAPTTPSGLRALFEFGAELMNSQHAFGSDLGAYSPGGTIEASAPSAEELFITALNRAAAPLLPAAAP